MYDSKKKKIERFVRIHTYQFAIHLKLTQHCKLIIFLGIPCQSNGYNSKFPLQRT